MFRWIEQKDQRRKGQVKTRARRKSRKGLCAPFGVILRIGPVGLVQQTPSAIFDGSDVGARERTPNGSGEQRRSQQGLALLGYLTPEHIRRLVAVRLDG
jgi:hypothetical protein